MMKSIRAITLVTVPAVMLWAAFAQQPKAKPVAVSDDPFSDDGEAAVEEELSTPMIAMVLEWIEVDHRAANKLIRKHITNKIIVDGLREDLEVMLDLEEARLIETAYLCTTNGLRTKSESVDEFIYPTEFDPAEIPQTFNVTGPIDIYPSTPANPTAFDFRNVGTTVEVEPQLDIDGKTISLNIAPEIVRHLGDRYMGAPEAPHELLAAVKQPDFYVMKTNTTIVVQSGHYTLVSVNTPSGDEDKRVLLMLRANVIR